MGHLLKAEPLAELAAFAAQWKLVFEERFENEEPLAENWRPLGESATAWRVKNGWLALERGTMGDAALLCLKTFAGDLRVEYECRADENICDLSLMLGAAGHAAAAAQAQAIAGLWSQCYFFGFGGDGNAFSKFARRGEMLDWYVPRIEPGKARHVVCERDGAVLRHAIDGELWLEYMDKQPLLGEEQAWFGFYFYGAGRIRNVKIFMK